MDIAWKTIGKIADDSGVSRSYVKKLIEDGILTYAKGSASSNSLCMISVEAFNKHWEKQTVFKAK